MYSKNKYQLENIRKIIEDCLLHEYEDSIKPPIFIAFKEGDIENKFIEELEKNLIRKRNTVLRFNPEKAKGTTVEEIRRAIGQSIIFIVIFSLSKFPKNSVPAWPIFELGIAYAYENEIDCILAYLDKELATVKEEEEKKMKKSGIDGKSECGKLDGNILRIITTPKIINLRDEKSYEDKIKKILEFVKPHSERWWAIMRNNYFKNPAKIESYRHSKFKKLYLEEKDL